MVVFQQVDLAPPPPPSAVVLRTPRKRGRIQVVAALPPRILPCVAGEGDHEVVEGARTAP